MGIKRLFVTTFFFISVLLLWGQCDSPKTSLAKPASQWPDFTTDGGWCWFSDPRAIYFHGEKEQTYAAWVDSSGNIMIGAYDFGTGKIRTTVLHSHLQRDDHDVPSILIRNDGRLLTFYSRHGGKKFFLRISENPEDISRWQPEQELRLNENDSYPADYRRTYTYSNPYQLSDENGRIFLFWRGIGFKPNISISEDGGQTWSKGRILIFPKNTYKNQRPYVKYASNYKDKIHIAFTDGHPRKEPTNGIYYACYREGAFFRADGSKISNLKDIPMAPREADVVYDAQKTGVRAWVWDVAEDGNGYPVIVYTRLPAETDHRYRYARWDGKEWLDHQIVSAGKWFPQTPPGKTEREPHYSGGIALNHSHPSTVFLSRPIEGIFEIEKWTTGDLGRTWTSQPITRNSRHDNVRPFVPWFSPEKQGPHLLWLNNTKYIHYTNFRSAIKMTVLN